MNGRALALAIPLILTAVNDRGFWGYWVSNPGAFDLSSLASVGRHAVFPLLLVLLAAVICRGLGRRFFFEAEPEIQLGLGFGIWATIIFLVGLAGFYNGTAFVVIALAFAFFGRNGFKLQSFPRGTGFSLFEGLCAGLVTGAAASVLTNATAPVTEWDSLAYHLAIPELYLKLGRITEISWLTHSHWPHLSEVFQGQALALGLEPLASLWHAALGALLVLAVFRFARRELGGRAAWAATALLAVQPVFVKVSGLPHSDAAFALFHFLSALALWRWTKEGGSKNLLAAGLLAGFCAAAKLHGFLFIAIWTAWMLLKKRPKDALLFLGTALLPSTPWLLKTWVGAGNPVWPFIFGGSHGADVIVAASRRLDYWRLEQWSAVLPRHGLAYLVLPAAGLALAARKRLPPFLGFLLLPALPYALAVLPVVDFARYLLPLYPALALAAGWGLQELWGGGRARQALCAALFCAALVPALSLGGGNALYAAFALRSTREPSRDARELYQERVTPHRRFHRRAAALLPKGSRVLLWRELRGYGLGVDYIWGDPTKQGLIYFERLENPRALELRLAELGITHILVNDGAPLYRRGNGYYPERSLALMDGVLARSRKLLDEDGQTLHAPRGAGHLKISN